jgi:hypothetical protein
MEKKNTIDPSRPLFTVSVGEFLDLVRTAVGEEDRTIARGLTELAGRLGCGRSKVSELRRLGVLDGAVISEVGRQKVFDVRKAVELAGEYTKNKKETR